MKTICRVKSEPSFLALIVNLQFIDITRAKPCTGTSIGLKTQIHTEAQIVNNQMTRLIFPVLRFGQIDTCELVHKESPVICLLLISPCAVRMNTFQGA